MVPVNLSLMLIHTPGWMCISFQRLSYWNRFMEHFEKSIKMGKLLHLCIKKKKKCEGLMPEQVRLLDDIAE